MKKLMVILIALSFFAIGSGSALADEPETSNWDEHAVWSKWYDQDGNRLPQNPDLMGSNSASERKVSTKTPAKLSRVGEAAEFDFIRETKTYDYSKDRGDSA